jgi:hypothetical protein
MANVRWRIRRRVGLDIRGAGQSDQHRAQETGGPPGTLNLRLHTRPFKLMVQNSDGSHFHPNLVGNDFPRVFRKSGAAPTPRRRIAHAAPHLHPAERSKA